MSRTRVSRSSALQLAAVLVPVLAAAPLNAQYTAQSLAGVIRTGIGQFGGMTEQARVWGTQTISSLVPRLSGAGGVGSDIRDYVVPAGFDRGGSINSARDDGVAVGTISKTTQQFSTAVEAVRWNSPTDIVRLGFLGVYASSRANDVNASGRLVGDATGATVAPSINAGRGFY